LGKLELGKLALGELVLERKIMVSKGIGSLWVKITAPPATFDPAG